MRRSWLLAILAALLGQMVPALAAPQVTVPGCEALHGWAARVNPAETYPIAPRLTLPKAFEDAQLAPLFGVPATAWSAEDVQAVSQALGTCYKEAAARRDKASAEALAVANRTLLGVLPRTNAVLQKAKSDSETFKKQIDGLANAAELSRAISVLLKADPAAPNGNAYQGLPREVVDPVWRLAQTVPNLSNADRAPLYNALGERRDAIEAGITGDTEKAIAAAPGDASGIVGLIEARQRAATIGDADAKARLQQSADRRIREIGDTLRQAKPAVWVPPDCLDLYRWSAAPNAASPAPLGDRGSLPAAFLDERVAPLFGVALGDWTDQDVALFKSLRTACQAQWQAQAAVPGNTGPNAPELVQLASKGRWIDAADKPVADARTVIAAYRKGQQAVAVAVEKVKTLPDATTSIPALAQIAADPALASLSPAERNTLVAAVNAKGAAISAHAVDDALKGLADVKVASLSDLAKLWAFGGQTLRTIPDARGQQVFGNAFAQSVNAAAGKVLPEFQAKLGELPASPDGIADAKAAVTKLTGIDDGGRLTGLNPYREAVQARVAAIAKSMRDTACANLLSSLNLGNAAQQDVWAVSDSMKLGDFLCGLAEHGTEVVSYEGGGLFSSTQTLKIVPIMETLTTLSLRQAEVKPGKSMLVGVESRTATGDCAGVMKDRANGCKLAMEEWEMYGTEARGESLLKIEGCKRLAQKPADQIDASDKLFSLSCMKL